MNIGDVVVVNSGGPSLTVQSLTDSTGQNPGSPDTATVIWFEQLAAGVWGGVRRETLPIANLKEVSA